MRLFTHRFFAPCLVLAMFGLGAMTVAFLLVGPGMAPWADTLLTACFGWNAETRHYRLDALILTLLQPPLFAAGAYFFYTDDLRAFLRSPPPPAFSLTAPRGAAVPLASFKARPVAMTFVYANCHATCPILVQRLRALE